MRIRWTVPAADDLKSIKNLRLGLFKCEDQNGPYDSTAAES